MPGRKRKFRAAARDNTAYTINEFCENNRISEAHYYSLKRQGKGPREIKLGRRILISPESEEIWRRAREKD
jgi:hypothetical protein